jgi:Carboxypeptidase regulatory-like domain
MTYLLVLLGRARMLAFCGAMFCLVGVGFAQSTNSGEIRGTVTDPTGAAVPNAKVTVLNVDTGVSIDYSTNAAGLYDTVSILPGRYRVTFSKEGFSTLVRDGITLEVGAPVTVDARLNVGVAQQQVQVEAEAPLVKTETAEQSSTLGGETMTELPNVTRTWENFTIMLPGVSQAPTDGSFAVNGTMPAYANYLADGASATLSHSSNVVPTNFEATAEVQIITSIFSAQYGTGAAVVNQISKSGTNQLHGSLYEFLQNNDLNARSFFAGSVPVDHFNDFGGSISGPIRKDKAFLFFNVEKIFNDTVNYTYYTFPTADMLAGNFSNKIFPTIYDPSSALNGTRTPFPGNVVPTSRMDPLAVAVQKFFPSPSLPGYANNLLATLPSNHPNLTYFGRFDYNISARNRVTASVDEFNGPGFTDSPDCPIDCYSSHNYEVSSQISDVFTITPAAVNEFRIGFTRQDVGNQSKDLGANYPQMLGWTYAEANMFPNVGIGGPVGATNIGNVLDDAIYAQNVFDPSDTLTWIHGRHVLHFGAEVLYLQDNDTAWGNRNSGGFTFSGVYTSSAPFGSGGLGYADFLLGEVAAWSATNSPIKAMREIQPQMFVQDDFKVKPNLTVNLGLRYQIQGGWHELQNKLGSFDPTVLNPATNTLGAVWFSPSDGRNSIEAPVYNIVLPRVGFAWNFKPNWVIRGGFGVYTYGWSEDTYTIGAGFGASSTGSLSDSTQAKPVFSFSAANPPLNYVVASKAPGAYNGQNVSYAIYHTPVARNYQWSLSLQRQLGGGIVAEAAYVGNHANGLAFPGDENQVPWSELGMSSNPQSLRPYPQFLNLNGNSFNAISNYDSLQTSLQKRFAAGVSFNVNYTWSKMLSTEDSAGWGGHAGNQYYQSIYYPGVNYGLANVNRAQMFKANFVYDIPVGKGKTLLNRGGPLDWVLGGWEASSILIVETGQPYAAIMGTQNLSGALSGNWFPNVIGDPALSNPTIHQYFNTAAFAEPAAFTFGNAGRNTLVGPGMSDINFLMAKSFAVPKLEHGRLQLRFDATNIINHPSFSNPNASIGTPNAGIITSTTVGGRAVQLGARLSF